MKGIGLAAAASALAGGVVDWGEIAALKLAYEARILSRMGGKRRIGNESEKARKYGISKAFRQYARRHGKGIDDILQMHAKFPVPHIDHARDQMSRRHGRAMLKILKKERMARAAGATR